MFRRRWLTDVERVGIAMRRVLSASTGVFGVFGNLSWSVFCSLLGLLFSMTAANADKVVTSGKPLLLYAAYATNPDCSSAGAVVMRVSQGPEHGRVSIGQTGVFPRFPEANPRSICNRRRVPGVKATYVSQRGYLGPDSVVLEVFFPAGRAIRLTFPIRVM